MLNLVCEGFFIMFYWNIKYGHENAEMQKKKKKNDVTLEYSILQIGEIMQ